MDKKYLVIETTGAFTPENPPKVGQEVWVVDPLQRPMVQKKIWVKSPFMSQHNALHVGLLFPARELAEASAKSYQTAAARGAKLVEALDEMRKEGEFLTNPNDHLHDRINGRVLLECCDRIQSILNDEVNDGN